MRESEASQYDTAAPVVISHFILFDIIIIIIEEHYLVKQLSLSLLPWIPYRDPFFLLRSLHLADSLLPTLCMQIFVSFCFDCIRFTRLADRQATRQKIDWCDLLRSYKSDIA